MDEDLRVPLFSSTMDIHSEDIKLMYDIDGVTIQLDKSSGIKPHLHYLKFPLPTTTNVTKHYHLLKKHFPLTECSKEFRADLMNIRGMTLGMISTGHFFNLTVIPHDPKGSRCVHFEEKVALKLTVDKLTEVRNYFVELLRTSDDHDMSRSSMKKNSLSNPSMFDMIWEDQEFVLDLLDQAKDKADKKEHATFLYTLTQFGQKHRDTLDISKLVHTSHINSASLHFAVEILPRDHGTQIFWSRNGVEEWVGQRGTVFPSVGMSETSNFQSSIGAEIDVSAGLMDVLGCQGYWDGHLNFLQLYADSPHTHITKWYKHPVSGVVTCCGLLHWNLLKIMHNRAQDYLAHMLDTATKFRGFFGLRIEQVRLFKGNCLAEEFQAEDRFVTSKLREELLNKALILPFANVRTSGLKTVLAQILDFHLVRLHDIFATRGGKGGFAEAWKAYQSELALEELFYGHPLAPGDRQLTQILGTSASGEKSVTRLRGFPALAPHNSATSEVSPPPLTNWTQDTRSRDRIRRMFKFIESLKAAPPVLGAELWNLLLADLKSTSRLHIDDFKGEKSPGLTKIVGAQQPEELIQLLTIRNAFPFPMLFQKAQDLVEKSGGNLKECLTLGLKDLNLTWFPKIQIWETKNPRASWNQRSVVQLYGQDKPLQMETRAARVEEKVITEMERRGLVFSRKLERYQEHGMPWVALCMKRMARANPRLDDSNSLRIITFLSCIALIENNDYVDFRRMQELIRELPLTMNQLQQLLLLSKFTLPHKTPFQLWKLHESIPTRLPPRGSAPPKKARQEEVQPEQPVEEEDVQRVEEEEEEGSVRKGLVRFYPSNSKVRWKSEEMSLVSLDPKLTHRQAYDQYIKEVEKCSLPARTFISFWHTRKKMSKST